MKKAIAVLFCLGVLAGAVAAEREPTVYKTTKLSSSDVLVTCKNGAEVQVKPLAKEKAVILSCEN
jgi:hypothetical protein